MTVVAWSVLEPGMSALLSRLSGIPASAVAPTTAPTGEPTTAIPLPAVGAADGAFRFASDVKQARVDWKIRSVAPVGTDELRPRYDPAAVIAGDTSGPGGTPATGGVIYESVGSRRYLFEIRVECGRQDVTGRAYAEAIRDRLPLPSSLRELRGLGLAFVRSGPVHDAGEYDQNGRAVSVYVLEITCTGASFAMDLPVTTIETVETTVDVLGE